MVSIPDKKNSVCINHRGLASCIALAFFILFNFLVLAQAWAVAGNNLPCNYEGRQGGIDLSKEPMFYDPLYSYPPVRNGFWSRIKTYEEYDWYPVTNVNISGNDATELYYPNEDSDPVVLAEYKWACPCDIVAKISPPKTEFNPRSCESIWLYPQIINGLENQVDYTWQPGTGPPFKETIFHDLNAGGYWEGLGSWDGKGADGKFAAPGQYAATLSASVPQSQCSETASVDITVASCNVSISDFKSENDVVNPDTGQVAVLTASVASNIPEPIWGQSYCGQQDWQIEIEGVKTIKGTGPVKADWDGKYENGEKVPAGSYSVKLTVRPEDAFCTDTKTIRVTVSRTQNTCFESPGNSTFNVATGNITHEQKLFSLKGGALPIDISLTYESLDSFDGVLGAGWSHNYEIGLKDSGLGTMVLQEGSGQRLYILSGSVYMPQANDASSLVKNSDGTFTLSERDGLIQNFEQSGRIVSRIDRNGATMTFSYSNGHLSGVTDSAGRTATFSYDENSLLTSITDPKGNVYAFGYEDMDLVSVANPDGGQWLYTYDEDGFMLTKTDPEGNYVTYTYDAFHRVLNSTDPSGLNRGLNYAVPVDGFQYTMSTTFKEKDGGEWTTTYDTSTGTLTSKTDPLGNVTSYTYDSNKNMASKTGPLIGTTSYAYDAKNNMVSSTDALGNVTNFTYNNRGQVLTISGAQGTTSTTYDDKGNTLTTTDPTGATWSNEYDSRGNLSRLTDATGKATIFIYDTSGMLNTVTDPTGAVTAFTYDANGNLETTTDAAGKVTKFAHDGMNRLVTITDPLRHLTTYTYDKLGNRTSIIDANNNTISYKYNHRGQITEVRDAQGNVTSYEYSATGCPTCGGGVDKLTALVDAKGQKTSWRYDLLGHLLSETDPLLNVTSYTYDAAGNQISRTAANGTVTEYSYDPLQRLVSSASYDGSKTSKVYDPAGHVQRAANKNIVYTYTYDAAGRVTQVADSRGYTLSYEYDLAGNRTAMKIQPKNSEERITTYVYDDGNRLISLTSPAGTFTYRYNGAGRRESLSYPNGIVTSYSYDDAGGLTGLTHSAADTTIASFAYELDKAGNRTRRTAREAEQYLYDTVYRLLTLTSSNPEAFSYDAVGNRQAGPGGKDVDSLYNAGNQMIQGRKLSYRYDGNGNQTSRIVPSATDKSWTQTWDNENRLVKVEKVKGTESKRVTFSYDPMGRRIGKQVTAVKDGIAKVSSWTYVYDNDDVAVEILIDEAGAVTKTLYTHGGGVDEHLALQRNQESYYFLADGLGSVVSITDKNKNVVQSYEYDAFGVSKPSSTFINAYTFTGREWDKETGLYYYRARYYDPMEGRFISKDPIGFKGGINLYGYVQNNPINLRDPSGLDPFGPNGKTNDVTRCHVNPHDDRNENLLALLAALGLTAGPDAYALIAKYYPYLMAAAGTQAGQDNIQRATNFVSGAVMPGPPGPSPIEAAGSFGRYVTDLLGITPSDPSPSPAWHSWFK